MKISIVFSFLVLFSTIAKAQKIVYSSYKKYQNIKVGVKYPAVVKKVDTREIENAALVQTPFVTSKKQIYGTLVKTK